MTENVARADLVANLGFVVDNGRLEYGDRPRPATAEETALWGAAMAAKTALRKMTDAVAGADAVLREKSDANAHLLADNHSLKSSCNAYQEELERLRVYAEANWVSPVLPPRTVPTLDMFAEIVQSHNAQKKRLRDKALEIWKIEPGTDIFEFMFRQLQHLNGEMSTETEERRRKTIKERAERFPGDPMNSMLTDELDKVHAKIAGNKVQE